MAGFYFCGMEYDFFALAYNGAPAYFTCTSLGENRYELNLVSFARLEYYDSIPEKIVLTKEKRWKSEPFLEEDFFKELVRRLEEWRREGGRESLGQ